MYLECVMEVDAHSSRVWDVDWHPKLPVFATCGEDKVARVWRINEEYEAVELACLDSHRGSVRSCEFSKDGRFLATASFDGSVIVWTCDSIDLSQNEWEIVTTLEGHEKEVKGVSWSSSGELLATCGRDRTVWVWEMFDDGDFECLAILQGHDMDVKSVVWAPNMNILVSASYDNTLRVWEETDEWKTIRKLKAHESSVWSADFNSSGTQMVSCDQLGEIILWNCANGHWECIYNSCPTIRDAPVYSVSWSRLNNRIATGSADGSISILDPTSEMMILARERYAHDGREINCVKWNPNEGNLLLSGGDDFKVRLWEVCGRPPFKAL